MMISAWREVKDLKIFRIFALTLFFIWLTDLTSLAGVPVAVFPLQALREGRNDANLPFTRVLIEGLAQSGNEIIDLDTVVTFMANNRIRTVGHLETFYISRVLSDLGAPFVLLGTVSQEKEGAEPSVGLTLNLVRTSDARTIWSYVGSMSTSDEIRVLGIGEPETTADLQDLLLNEIIEQWPLQMINEAQQAGLYNIDSAVLEPEQVRPGDEVHIRVRLRDIRTGGQAPRVFFWADNQLYPATASADGLTYRATWVAGEENGRFPVTLLMEWPHYGRVETALLGNYIIDGTPPLFEVELRGSKDVDGKPIFGKSLTIVPRMLVRKPLSHWRLAFYFEGDDPVGYLNGAGNLPESFIYQGQGGFGDGSYTMELEVWDKAGNYVMVSKELEMNRSLPEVDLALEWNDEGMAVELEHEGKVPLEYWRMDLWTNEGKMLTQTQGKELPVRIGIDLPSSYQDKEIKGFVIMRNALDQKVSRKIEDLLPHLRAKAATDAQKAKPTGISESWVDEF